jgi:hypothetical protein
MRQQHIRRTASNQSLRISSACPLLLYSLLQPLLPPPSNPHTLRIALSPYAQLSHFAPRRLGNTFPCLHPRSQRTCRNASWERVDTFRQLMAFRVDPAAVDGVEGAVAN